MGPWSRRGGALGGGPGPQGTGIRGRVTQKVPSVGGGPAAQEGGGLGEG